MSSIEVEEVIVKKAKPAVTKQVMAITMPEGEKRLCEDYSASRSFLRKNCVVIPTVLLVGFAALLYTTGALKFIGDVLKDWHPMLCMGDHLDPPECREEEPGDLVPLLLFLVSAGLCFFVYWAIKLGIQMKNSARAVEAALHALLQNHGWDGTTPYRLKDVSIQSEG